METGGLAGRFDCILYPDILDRYIREAMNNGLVVKLVFS